jgi:hypothetical protein
VNRDDGRGTSSPLPPCSITPGYACKTNLKSEAVGLPPRPTWSEVRKRPLVRTLSLGCQTSSVKLYLPLLSFSLLSCRMVAARGDNARPVSRSIPRSGECLLRRDDKRARKPMRGSWRGWIKEDTNHVSHRPHRDLINHVETSVGGRPVSKMSG